MISFTVIKRAGVGTKVYGAIGAIVVLTVAASALAFLSFQRVDSTIHSLVEERYPVVEVSLKLAQAATEALAMAPKLAEVVTEQERAGVVAQLNQSDQRMRALVDELDQRGAIDKAAFLGKIDALSGGIRNADAAARQRIAIEAEKAQKGAQLTKASDTFNEVLLSAADEAQFNLLMGMEDAGKREGDELRDTLKQLTDKELGAYGGDLTLLAEVNKVAGLLREVLVLDRREMLVPASDRCSALSQRASKALKEAEKAGSDPKRRKATEAVLAFATGDGSLLKLRERDFGVRDSLTRSLVAASQAAKQLNGEVERIVAEARSSAESATQSSQSLIGNSKLWLVIIGIFSVIAAIGIAVFYVRPMIVARLRHLWAATTAIAEGKLDTGLDTNGQDEVAGLARSVELFRDKVLELRSAEAQAADQRQAAEAERSRNEAARSVAAAEVQKVADALGAALESLAKGDLSYRVNADLSDEYRQIQDNFNAAVARLQETIRAIAASAKEVSSAAVEISTSTTDLSQRTEEQAASLEETSASMEEISRTVRKNAENAQAASQLAGNTQQIADRGGAVVAEAVQAMSRIEESSHKVGDIIGVIDEIARQTNLLALNAAVEAARAGEAGRGFAVVASEVRSLAQRSSQAARDIKELITNSGAQVAEGVQLVNRAGSSLGEIVESIKRVAAIVAEIATASAEQTSGLEQITTALTQMDEVTQQNSALVEENAAAAKALEGQSGAMDERVRFFQVGESAQPQPQRMAS
jgi:methyl-accepting chemotaxis protein